MLDLVSLVLEKLKPPVVLVELAPGCAEDPVAVDPEPQGVDDCAVDVEDKLKPPWLEGNPVDELEPAVEFSAGLEAGVLLCPKENPLLSPLPASRNGVGRPNLGLSSLASSLTCVASDWDSEGAVPKENPVEAGLFSD